MFSNRSKATPVSGKSPANAKQLEEAVTTAVKEAEMAALKVEEAMLGALQAAQDMESGTQRAFAEKAVQGAATQLRGAYNSYERLEEEVAAEIQSIHGPSFLEKACGCFSDCCGAITGVVVGTFRVVLSTLRAMQTPALFYVVGCLVYNYLEGWGPLDTVYFLTVTSTTVGYGDYYPETNAGKLFTCFYALIGITVVLGSLAPLVAFLRGDWREKLLSALGCAGPKVNMDDPALTMEQINRLMNYRQRYALALIGPGFVLVSGMCMHYTMIREAPSSAPAPLVPSLGPLEALEPALSYLAFDFDGLIDSFYWAVITMTTIGYGDITPSSHNAKLLAILYLPLAVIALADAVSDVQMIGLRRSIRETDFSKVADECLLRDALRDDGPPNVEPVLNEAEFLVDQLIANELVDEEAVKVINKQFQYLTRKGTFGPDEPRTLTPSLVYEEMRERVAARKELSEGATAADVNADGSFKWATFDEWNARSWKVRVLQKYAEKTGIAAKKRKDGLGRAGQMKTVIGAHRGKAKR